MRNQKECSERESRKEQRRARKKRRRQRRIFLFILSVLTVLLLFFIGSKIRQKIEEHQLYNTPNKSFAGAPPFEVDLLDVNEYSRPGTPLEKIKGIVVHYTANPGTTAKNNRDYFEGLKDSHETKVSSHFVIGIDGEIIQCIPTNEIAYASNSRNEDTISIECCHKAEDGKFTKETYISLVRLTAWLCYRFQLNSNDVIRHYDVTGKNCPKYYVENPKEWKHFRRDVADQIEKVKREVQKKEAGS